MPKTTTFSENLTFLMEKRGLRQADLAKRVGLDSNYFAAYLKKGSIPSVTIGVQIAKALGVRAEDLIDENLRFTFTEKDSHLQQIGELNQVIEVAGRMIELSSIPAAIKNSSLTFITANPAFCELIGISREALINQNQDGIRERAGFSDEYDFADREVLARGKESTSFSVRRVNGTLKAVRFHKIPFVLPGESAPTHILEAAISADDAMKLQSLQTLLTPTLQHLTFTVDLESDAIHLVAESPAKSITQSVETWPAHFKSRMLQAAKDPEMRWMACEAPVETAIIIKDMNASTGEKVVFRAFTLARVAIFIISQLR
jgi:transcriptional regulator with XRE-family HTH domain